MYKQENGSIIAVGGLITLPYRDACCKPLRKCVWAAWDPRNIAVSVFLLPSYNVERGTFGVEVPFRRLYPGYIRDFEMARVRPRRNLSE